jgi:aminoglycoside N3'-acetyltransferase
LVVNSYTFQVARHGIPYEHETTPCTTGAFSQFILDQPGRLRSLHPVFSVAGLGPQAEAICGDVSRTNYGAGSPVERLLQTGAKVLRLGLDYAHNVFSHYAEAVCGVPYMYNKVLDVVTRVNGREVPGPFLAFVRFLNLDLAFDFSSIRTALDRKALVKSAPLGAGQVHAVSAAEYTSVAIRLLTRDPYAFLTQPPAYVRGVIPFDGLTQGRDGVS